MSEEEKRAEKARKMREYRANKKFKATQSALDPADRHYYDTQIAKIPPEERERLARKVAEQNGLVLELSDEESKELAKALNNSPIQPIRPISRREQALAIIADADERHKRADLAVEPFKKYASNPTNILLLEILRINHLARLELVDLIGGLS